MAPWACPNSGFNLRMEALLVILCKVMTVSQVAQLPGVSDGRIWRTLDHYVDQAHAQEDFSTVTSAGLDETASRRGRNDISLFHDLDAQRVLYACEGRKPGAWPSLLMRSRLMVPVPGTAARSVWICRQATRLACVSICPGPQSPSMSFTSFSLSTRAVDAVRRQEVKRAPERRRTRCQCV